MSKGAGAIGIREVRATVVRAVGRVGGLHGADFSREGMRGESLAYWRSRFAGKPPAEVRELAEHGMPPVRVTIFVEHGRRRLTLEDGRHRLEAARAAGATRVRAEVRIVGERGGSSTRWTGTLRV